MQKYLPKQQYASVGPIQGFPRPKLRSRWRVLSAGRSARKAFLGHKGSPKMLLSMFGEKNPCLDSVIFQAPFQAAIAAAISDVPVAILYWQTARCHAVARSKLAHTA